MEVKGPQVKHFKVQQTFDAARDLAARSSTATAPAWCPDESAADNSPLPRSHQLTDRISKLKYNSAPRPVSNRTVRHRELSLQMAAWRHDKPPRIAEALPAHFLM